MRLTQKSINLNTTTNWNIIKNNNNKMMMMQNMP